MAKSMILCFLLLLYCSTTSAFVVGPASSRRPAVIWHPILSHRQTTTPKKKTRISSLLQPHDNKEPNIAMSLWKRVKGALHWPLHFSSWPRMTLWRKNPEKDAGIAEDESKSETSMEQQIKNKIVGEAQGTPNELLNGSRWAIAAPSVDFSGTWKPIVTPAFKEEYDKYLTSCGEGIFFRKALLAAIGLGMEVYEQKDRGRELSITGVTPLTRWKRTLIASGAEQHNDDTYEPVLSSFLDPDGDTVQVEAWWEEGTVHRSILRKKPRLLGGEIETKRFLLPDDPNTMVCESMFHPPLNHSSKFQEAQVEWRFERQ